MSSSIPVYSISLPEYKIEPGTDWKAVGGKLDQLIMTHFQGKWLAIRAVGLFDHPGRTLDDLVGTILELGTDKYDPNRKGLYYARDEVSDIAAGPCLVTNKGLESPDDPDEHAMPPGPPGMEGTVLDFCEGTLADRGYAVRLDILMLYDLDQLRPVAPGLAPQVCYEFSFKHPDRKQEALLGVIKILRE
jgi:hypothetical protein